MFDEFFRENAEQTKYYHLFISRYRHRFVLNFFLKNLQCLSKFQSGMWSRSRSRRSRPFLTQPELWNCYGSGSKLKKSFFNCREYLFGKYVECKFNSNWFKNYTFIRQPFIRNRLLSYLQSINHHLRYSTERGIVRSVPLTRHYSVLFLHPNNNMSLWTTFGYLRGKVVIRCTITGDPARKL